MIENITEIESSLELAEGTLKEAIASADAVNIDIPAGKFFDTETHVIKTKDDHDQYINNLRNQYADENKKAGLEVAVKNYKSESGLEFEGKTIEKLAEAITLKAQADAKVEPNTKIEELNKDLKRLKEINEGWETKYNDLNNSTAKQAQQRTIDGNILSNITGELTLPKEQIMILFKAEYEVVEEDGKMVVKKGGETLKNDSNLDPIPLKDIVSKFIETFAKKPSGGAGGGDTTGEGKAGSMEAFIKEMEADGKSVGSEEFNVEMQRRIADKTLEV